MDKTVDKNTQIVSALKCCQAYGGEGCGGGCPYYGENHDGMSCRQNLCHDAAEALAAAVNRAQAMSEEVEDMANERTDLIKMLHEAESVAISLKGECAELQECLDWNRKELAKKQTSVCFVEEAPQEAKIEGLQNDVKKLVEAVNFWRDKANYWQGIADGIKWGVHDRFNNTDNASEDAVEVPDDV